MTEGSKLVRQAATMLVTDVDRGRGSIPLSEQPPICVEVLLECAVKVQVVLGQVREDETREAGAVEALELRRVRGGLHRAAAVPDCQHRPERALQVDRLRSRSHGGLRLAADARLDRREERRALAGLLEYAIEEVGRRRLAVRTGHPGDEQVPRRISEEGDRRHGHRRAGVVDDELGHIELERSLAYERYRATVDRGRREVVSVGAQPGDAEEQRAGRRLTGVIDKVAYLRRSAPHHLPRSERRDEPLQLHAARVYQG